MVWYGPFSQHLSAKLLLFSQIAMDLCKKNKRVLISYYMCTFAPDIATPHTQVPVPMTIQEVSEKK